MLVTKEVEIDMGHRVPNHESKCRNFHGHRYKIEAGVDDKVIETKGACDEGMVIDFGELKEIMTQEISDLYDHSCVVYEKDEFIESFLKMKKAGLNVIVIKFIPTAENMAMLWFRAINERLEVEGIKLQYVKVWETPTSTALYTALDNKKYVDKGQTRLSFK